MTFWDWLFKPGLRQVDRIASRYGRPGERTIVSMTGEIGIDAAANSLVLTDDERAARSVRCSAL